jgi:hypothetical protein
MLEAEFVTVELAVAEGLPEVVLSVGPMQAEVRSVSVDLAADRVHWRTVEQLRNIRKCGGGRERKKKTLPNPSREGGRG